MQDFAAKYWMEKGCPADKLVLGMGTYGRSFELVNPAENGLNAPAKGGGVAGKFTREKGFLSYYEVL
jgi:chitinase